MFAAPSPSLGLAGWLLFGLLWVGVALLVWEVTRPVRRRLFPPRRGEYVRVLDDTTARPLATPRPLTKTEARQRRERWEAAQSDPSPRPRGVARG